MTIYIDIAMSIIEGVSWMSKSGYRDRELLEYIYINTMTRLNANSIERCIKNPKSVIIIFALNVN